ncbi:hypothetical protein ACIRTB_20925 [Streptomyces sp. NPDC101158]|uniref:hypothetical protein n=1 Tax=Streptomyces sp. NPDC101158 TaxID=3366117 RepID=UPI00381BE555
MTAAEFRAANGDPTTWSPADFDTYETTAQLENPAFAEAATTGQFVLGLHDENGHVVVDLATADEMATHHMAGTIRSLIGGTAGLGPSSAAALHHLNLAS